MPRGGRRPRIAWRHGGRRRPRRRNGRRDGAAGDRRVGCASSRSTRSRTSPMRCTSCARMCAACGACWRRTSRCSMRRPPSCSVDGTASSATSSAWCATSRCGAGGRASPRRGVRAGTAVGCRAGRVGAGSPHRRRTRELPPRACEVRRAAAASSSDRAPRRARGVPRRSAAHPARRRPGPKVIAALVDDEAHRALRRAERAHGADDTEALHDLRKAGRRLRYAAEAVTDRPGRAFDGRIRSLAEVGDDLHDVLGDHRDEVLFAHARATRGGARRPRGRRSASCSSSWRSRPTSARPRTCVSFPPSCAAAGARAGLSPATRSPTPVATLAGAAPA